MDYIKLQLWLQVSQKSVNYLQVPASRYDMATDLHILVHCDKVVADLIVEESYCESLTTVKGQSTPKKYNYLYN